MKHLFFPATACVMALAGAAQADDVFNDDVIVTKSDTVLLCVGIDCANGEAIPSPFTGVIRLKSNIAMIDFDDTSGATFPDRDWRIQANETGGGGDAEAFFIRDVTAGNKTCLARTTFKRPGTAQIN